MDDVRPVAAYTLADRGVALRVETWVVPGGDQPNRARLLVDGSVVDEGAVGELGHLDLGADSGHLTRVEWWWTGRVARCDRMEPGLGGASVRGAPYAPPAGTWAARVHDWGEAHPVGFASRHVVLQLGGTLIALLGLGALIRAVVHGLLPRIDFSWLPDISSPAWLAYLDPGRYLAPLFGWLPPLLDRLLSWVPEVDLGWLRYALGFVTAIVIAGAEIRRRRRHRRNQAAGDGRER